MAVRRRVLFRIIKGFLYGNVIGIIAGIALYELTAAAAAIAQDIPVSASQVFYLVYAASVTIGVAAEYSKWLEQGGDDEAGQAGATQGSGGGR